MRCGMDTCLSTWVKDRRLLSVDRLHGLGCQKEVAVAWLIYYLRHQGLRLLGAVLIEGCWQTIFRRERGSAVLYRGQIALSELLLLRSSS